MSTIVDVAKKSGYSVATVSRCLNNSGRVSEVAKKAILSAAKELNYVPMLGAQMMRTNKSNLIALIILTLRNSYFVELAEFIDQECLKNGYKLLLFNIDNDKQKEQAYINLIGNLNIDGVLIAGSERTYKELRHIPVVLLDRVGQNITDVPTVTTKNYEGAFKLTKHLMEVGCKNLIFIAPKISNYASKERQRAFIDCAKDFNLNYSIYYADEYQANFRGILNEEFDGVFAWNDETAIDLLFYLHENGFEIPREIKLVGYDNNYLSQRVFPKITTIEQPYEEISKSAVEILIDKINGNDSSEKNIEIDVKLIKRGSTIGDK